MRGAPLSLSTEKAGVDLGRRKKYRRFASGNDRANVRAFGEGYCEARGGAREAVASKRGVRMFDRWPPAAVTTTVEK
jgi:putative hemolysin